jgi:hypothetical protein
MAKREAGCPLCGARLTAEQVLDACEESVGAGILGCNCPHCQGYFEVRPAAGRVDIGYLMNGLFDTVLALPCAGLAAERAADGTLRLATPERTWEFAA